MREIKGSPVWSVERQFSKRLVELCTEFNLTTGKSRPALVTASEDTIDYLFNGAGEVIVRIDTNPQSNRWRVLVYDSSGAERVLLDGVNNTGAPPAIVGALADGRLAALDFGEDDEIGVLYAIDSNSGKVRSRSLAKAMKFKVQS